MENNVLYFETEIRETLNYILNPATDFENMTRFRIQNLDPTGVVVGSICFTAKINQYERICDYSDSDLLTNKLKFVIDKDTYITEFVPQYQLNGDHLSGDANLMNGVIGHSGTYGHDDFGFDTRVKKG